MIIVRLYGGLGNQMFQYALGRSLALRNDTELKLDISDFENYKLHKYCLDVFNIQKKIASSREVTDYKKFKKKLGRRWFFHNKLIADDSKYFQEESFAFDPRALNLDNNVYIDGYWQSEKYFKDAEAVIRSDFSFVLPQGEKDKEVSRLINEYSSVSVHVRRTDYVTDTNAKKALGTCPIEYYTRAVLLMAQKVGNPHFFVFSDDHEWVKQNIKIDYPTVYVDHNDASTNYQDLRLMASCKHNIIANSSFSWWGAWLNGNPDKIIIAPKKWFTDISKDDSDLIPPTWIRI